MIMTQQKYLLRTFTLLKTGISNDQEKIKLVSQELLKGEKDYSQ